MNAGFLFIPDYFGRYFPSAVRGPTVAFLLVCAGLLAGCATGPSVAEREENARLSKVTNALRPADVSLIAAAPAAGAGPEAYFSFALSHQPRVAAAYYDWQAAVRAIPGARALPDPQLTFQADIAETVMSLMPGLMFDLMAPGKRAAMGAEATSAARVAYRTYAAEAVSAAAELRKSWIDLVYLDGALALKRERLSELEGGLAAAKAEYATGSGMGTLETQTRYLNWVAQLRSEIEGIEDRRIPARFRFKGALGLGPRDPDPAWPDRALSSAELPPDETLWIRLAELNPKVGSMRAMVDMAVAQAELARRTRTPDFAAGLMVDLKADPLMYRPTASLTLPVWREKIASAIQTAESRRLAAGARLDAEQLTMATELAERLFMAREAGRMLRYVETNALPNLDRAELSALASYRSSMGGFATLFELRLMKNDMRLERLEAQRAREGALADITSLIAAEPTVDRFAAAENTRK